MVDVIGAAILVAIIVVCGVVIKMKGKEVLRHDDAPRDRNGDR